MTGARVIKTEEPTNLLYGLDNIEFPKVHTRNDFDEVPPDILVCERTGLPLRPLYFDHTTGIAKRAVPISWKEGVDYAEWREKEAH